jgi:hypothetical protein
MDMGGYGKAVAVKTPPEKHQFWRRAGPDTENNILRLWRQPQQRRLLLLLCRFF